MGKPLKPNQIYQMIHDSVQQLESLQAPDRLQIFKILFPQFADLMEATWQKFDQWTYQMGYSRRSLSAPDAPEIYRYKREWCFKAFWDL